MISAWTSIRAFVTAFSMVAFGLTLVAVVFLGAVGRADAEMGKMALVALVGFLYAVKDAYFSSPSGTGTTPHAPTN